MKSRANTALVTAFIIITLVLSGCGGGKPSATTTSNAPATTSGTPATTSGTPATTSSAPATTSSVPTGNAIIVKVVWGIPSMVKTHPLEGAFENCYTCHLIGGVGAIKQIGASHSCDECHEPNGPGLTYNCTGGDPPSLPSCPMCHGPQRQYDGTKH